MKGFNMFEIMGKIGPVMDILKNITGHKMNISLDKSKILVSLDLSDNSTAQIYFRLDVKSKLQQEMFDKIKILVESEKAKQEKK